MEIVWRTTTETRDVTLQELDSAGVAVSERLGFEPLLTISAVAGVIALTQALARMYRDSRYRGVIIDLTTDPVEIREMPGWDRQHVLVVAADGPHFHTFQSEDELAALIEGASGS